MAWYVTEGNPAAITRFAYAVNTLHGRSTSEPERIEAAMWMVEGGASQESAAAAVNINQGKLAPRR